MKFADINEAIVHSEDYNEIAVVTVPDRVAAEAAIAEARAAAVSAGLCFEFTDTDSGWELWAWADDGTEDMQWRLALKEGEE